MTSPDSPFSPRSPLRPRPPALANSLPARAGNFAGIIAGRNEATAAVGDNVELFVFGVRFVGAAHVMVPAAAEHVDGPGRFGDFEFELADFGVTLAEEVADYFGNGVEDALPFDGEMARHPFFEAVVPSFIPRWGRGAFRY